MVLSREEDARKRESTVEGEIKGVRKKYSKELSGLEARIKETLNKQGFVFFEHTGGGVAMASAMATELKGRDEVIQSMKDVVTAAKTEKEEAESEKEALEVMRQNVERAQKDLDNFKRKEKEMRLKLEGNIVERMEKEGAVVLERGGVMTTPHQMAVDMKVRSEQLSSATVELRKIKKELDSTISKTAKELQKM